jgi:prolyl-tRNA editing enzyme YbaK/EbsC (Cys-tRNA(Pro) deacylase)
MASVQDLEGRISALEKARYPESDVMVDDSMRRARDGVEHHQIYSAVWKFVPPDYYHWPLEKRAAYLGALSIDYLCKSLLMENRKCLDSSDPTNPKFVLVIVQYAAALDVKKLTNTVRSLRKDVKSRLDDTQFDWRIASEDDNRAITGFEHNSVTPFGLLQRVPIILSAKLEPLKFFWMGGGHVHLKLGVSFTEFCRALDPIIADISRPRTEFEMSKTSEDDF